MSDAAAASNAIETWRGVVEPEHIDLMGHMNVAWYAAHFSEATLALFATIGISEQSIRDQHCGMAALEQHVTYLAEVFAGTELLIRSDITGMGRKSMRFVHRMFRIDPDREHLVARCEFIAVCFNLELRKSCPLPDAVRSAAEHHFHPESLE